MATSEALREAVERAADAFDEFIGFATGVAIEQAFINGPMRAHFELVGPLRELREEAIAWLNLVGAGDMTDRIHLPILPTIEDDETDQLVSAGRIG